MGNEKFQGNIYLKPEKSPEDRWFYIVNCVMPFYDFYEIFSSFSLANLATSIISPVDCVSTVHNIHSPSL